MSDCMTFPDTVEEFMEQYKIIDTEQIYTNGVELVPIFRMKQWFEHLPSAQPERKGKWIKGGEQPYFRKHFDIVVCSKCNKRGEHRWNFCPYCGADMRVAENACYTPPQIHRGERGEDDETD